MAGCCVANGVTRCAAVQSLLLREQGVKLSKRHIRRVLKKVGLKYVRPTKVPFLSESDMTRRVAFATAMLLRPDIGTFCFSDEKYFNLITTPASGWVRPCDRKNFVAPQHAHPPKSMCWLAMGDFGNGKWFSDLFWYAKASRQDAPLYVETLKCCFEPYCQGAAKTTLVQDNAPSHKAKSTLKYFGEQDKFTVLHNWPPRSPDLNVIENMWGWLSGKFSIRNPP